MNLFGGAKYSREAYKDAENMAISTNRALESRGTVSPSQAEEVYGSLARRALEAKKRLDEMYKKGQTEATALDEEYNHLVAKAKEAARAVEVFEEEKLGMGMFL